VFSLGVWCSKTLLMDQWYNSPMKRHNSFKGMTLLEVVFAMLLLGILMNSVAFSGSRVLYAVKNRTENASKYVLAMNKAQAVVLSEGQQFANSATFSISDTGLITYYEAKEESASSDVFTLQRKEVNLKSELQQLGLGVMISSTVLRVANDPNAVEVKLGMVDEDGRAYENAVFMRKVINASPLLPRDFSQRCQSSFASSKECTVPLMFPARGLLKDGNLVTSLSSNGFAQSTSTSPWQLADFTYRLTGTDNGTFNGITVYKNLKISTSATATILCPIVPPMVGIDGTITATAAVRVGGPQP